MQPRDVTTLFESISGSEALRKDYQAKEAEKVAAEERVSHSTARKRQLGAEKRQIKEQKEEAEKHMRLQKQLVRCSRQCLVVNPAACADALRPSHWLSRSQADFSCRSRFCARCHRLQGYALRAVTTHKSAGGPPNGVLPLASAQRGPGH